MFCNKLSIALTLMLATVGTVTYAADHTVTEQHASIKPLKGVEFTKDAKVNLVDARAIALKAHAGIITDEELEMEKGGSGLRYSFDIKHDKGTQEVGVDAKTGKVLENKLEGPNAD